MVGAKNAPPTFTREEKLYCTKEGINIAWLEESAPALGIELLSPLALEHGPNVGRAKGEVRLAEEAVRVSLLARAVMVIRDPGGDHRRGVLSRLQLLRDRTVVVDGGVEVLKATRVILLWWPWSLQRIRHRSGRRRQRPVAVLEHGVGRGGEWRWSWRTKARFLRWWRQAH